MTVTRAWPFGDWFAGIRANYQRSGTVPSGLACGTPLRADQIGRQGWAGAILESFFRETSDADPVANGSAVIDALVAAATPYVGTDQCKLPATLTVTVTGTRSSANDTLAENVQTWVNDGIAAAADAAAHGVVLVGIVAVLLLGLWVLFREAR